MNSIVVLGISNQEFAKFGLRENSFGYDAVDGCTHISKIDDAANIQNLPTHVKEFLGGNSCKKNGKLFLA